MEYLVVKKKEANAEKEMKKDERCRKAFPLQEERIRIERERVDMQREIEEERIMNIDMNTPTSNNSTMKGGRMIFLQNM
jgi:hypothetical protein